VQAADCLAKAIAGRIARGGEIPPPSKPKRGQHLIGVSLYLAPKLALYLAMRERRIPNTELAKRLGVSETVVRRMLNPRWLCRENGPAWTFIALYTRRPGERHTLPWIGVAGHKRKEATI